MTQHLMSAWRPAGATPPEPDELKRISRDGDMVYRQLEQEGAWVFDSGRHGPDSTTVCRPRAASP